jgi:splicing factor 3B subunit 3
VVIALSGGDLLYFELDAAGQLLEVDKKFIGKEIACIAIAPIPEGRLRTRFLAVADFDNTVRIFSLDPEDTLQSLSLQAVRFTPQSLCIAHMPTSSPDGGLYLNIGLTNGVLLRASVNPVTGELTDIRSRFLGSKGVKLFRVSVRGHQAMLALSSRSWLSYVYQSRTHMAPLSYTPLEYACRFSSEQCPEGIVAISGNELRSHNIPIHFFLPLFSFSLSFFFFFSFQISLLIFWSLGFLFLTSWEECSINRAIPFFTLRERWW